MPWKEKKHLDGSSVQGWDGADAFATTASTFLPIKGVGAARSMSQRAAYLKQLGASGKSPSWMNQWLLKGKVPPGYHVDHKIPLSIGGRDIPANMRLNLIKNHRLHHKYYRPWRRR
jgi:hypothetical protein